MTPRFTPPATAEVSDLGQPSQPDTFLPEIGRELRRTIVDLLRKQEPTSVLGVLLSRSDALTVEAIAGLLGLPVVEVELTVEMLEDEGLCARITQNGLSKVRGFAAHSVRNG